MTVDVNKLFEQIGKISQIGWPGEHPDRERVPAIVV